MLFLIIFFFFRFVYCMLSLIWFFGLHRVEFCCLVPPSSGNSAEGKPSVRRVMGSGVRAPAPSVDFHTGIATGGAKKVNMPASCNIRRQVQWPTKWIPGLTTKFFFLLTFSLLSSDTLFLFVSAKINLVTFQSKFHFSNYICASYFILSVFYE
jgi:hypothetical protein